MALDVRAGGDIPFSLFVADLVGRLDAVIVFRFVGFLLLANWRYLYARLRQTRWLIGRELLGN